MSSTICAISTSIGRAGLGIVRMTGDDSKEVLNKVFDNFENVKNKVMTYGHIIDNEKIVDEVLAVFMKGPHTYTREDVVEIYCHGGVVAVREVLNTLLKNGANLAEPGEFTKRAFLNGRLDLTQAEAVLDLIDSNTSLSYENSLNQLEGGISEKVDEIYSELMAVMASTITEIDFPEDENDTLSNEEKVSKLSPLLCEIEDLIKSSKRGKVLREGIKTLILGRPNVGKSSLLNTLLKENRAIVTDIPGTTRDIIEEFVNIKGIALKIVDTAGIRDTDDVVEKIGVEKSRKHLKSSDLTLVVLDNSREIDQEDIDILESVDRSKTLVILNKIDLESKLDLDIVKKYVDEINIINISALKNEGLDLLHDRIEDMVFSGEISNSGDVMITNSRHKDAIYKAMKAIEDAISSLNDEMSYDFIEVDLKDAWDALGYINGDTISEDLLDTIFSNFCIGK